MAGPGLIAVPPWRSYAAEAERSVLGRHLRRPWFAPWAHLATTAYPPEGSHRSFTTFHYWWQAHVLEALVDAQLRDPRAARRRLVARWPSAMALRNRARWLNPYYDDIAWLGLALDRAERDLGLRFPRPIATITTALDRAWAEQPLGGGIPWRVGDPFRNAPANGPMTILMARRGRVARALEALDWMNLNYLDPATGLVVDGVRPGPDGQRRVDRVFWTYNQGLLLGAEVAVLRAGLALGRLAERDAEASAARVHALVAAVDRWMAEDHVIVGFERRPETGGDAGLFAGILARYLGRVVTDLPGDGADAAGARRLAARLLHRTAEESWRQRTVDATGVWFGPDPRVPARIPGAADALAPGASAAGVGSATVPERDLSVQVGAWMVLEAAARAL